MSRPGCKASLEEDMYVYIIGIKCEFITLFYNEIKMILLYLSFPGICDYGIIQFDIAIRRVGGNCGAVVILKMVNLFPDHRQLTFFCP